MCGIVGILGYAPVATRLTDTLRRLEYRGYDSAGIATIEADGTLHRRRAPGKLRALEELLGRHPLTGHTGIGHTRWATHGAPSEANAHPHVAGPVAMVHNGIIENFRALREELIAEGARFESATDSEVVAHLVAHEMAAGATPEEAVRRALPRLQGAFALAFLFSGHDDLLIGARRGSPLAVGIGEGEAFLGSDAIALGPFTDRMIYLNDGDWVVLTRSSIQIFDESGQPVVRPARVIPANVSLIEKGNYRHFMAKEIHEQSEVVGHTLGAYLDLASGHARLGTDLPFDFAAVSRLAISACGTAYYAGLIGKYWFERYARLPVEIDVASEFRYREPPLVPGELALFISQSGETADTLASLRHCSAEGLATAAIVNVATSTIAREADAMFQTLAGPEIGVASTKAFTCQLATLACLAIAAGRARGTLTPAAEAKLVAELSEVPRLISQALRLEPQIEALSRRLARARDVLYLGRGTSFPLALEGALKLKEISYIHAEGYAAGELKHGPIALVDENLPVVVIAPHDAMFEKTVSNMQEVAARGGRIILLTDRRGAEAAGVATVETLVLPDVPAIAAPMVYAVPIQLLAYHTAVFNGTDVDQPRNLAKSVTVE